MKPAWIIAIAATVLLAIAILFRLIGLAGSSDTTQKKSSTPAPHSASADADDDNDNSSADHDNDSADTSSKDSDSAGDVDSPSFGDFTGKSNSGDSNSANSGDSEFGPTKQVEVTDPFFDNMVAFTITIPRDWVFEGTMLHGPGCMIDYQSYAYRVYSPDAAFGVQSVPLQSWYWADDQRARPEGKACKYFPAITAVDYASLFAFRMRPDAEIDGNAPTSDADEFYSKIEDNNNKAAESARRNNLPPEVDRGDASQIRIHYDWEGRAQEEWIGVHIVYKDIARNVLVYPGQGRPGHPEWLHFINTNATLVGRRAPRGKLQQYDGALLAIAKSVTANPQFVAAWQARGWQQVRNQAAASAQVTHTIVASIHNQMAVNQQNFQNFMARVTQQHQQFLANLQRQGEVRHQNFMAQMDAQTAHSRDFQDYILDQQYYVNPNTGETSTISGRSTHTWSNGPLSNNGTALVQSPDTNFNPNGLLAGNWTELLPIHH